MQEAQVVRPLCVSQSGEGQVLRPFLVSQVPWNNGVGSFEFIVTKKHRMASSLGLLLFKTKTIVRKWIFLE
jgi:hypothetical protein